MSRGKTYVFKGVYPRVCGGASPGLTYIGLLAVWTGLSPRVRGSPDVISG